MMYHSSDMQNIFLERVLDGALQSLPIYTNTVSNTAFRGFGGPQGMLVSERLIQEIAFKLDMDSLAVRKINLYGLRNRAITPYHQKIEDNITHLPNKSYLTIFPNLYQ